jgi:hypothetical protein
MRVTAKVVGILWMVACFGLWVWLGIPGLSCNEGVRFSVSQLNCESRGGLTMLPILLGLPGYLVWNWGRGGRYRR